MAVLNTLRTNKYLKRITFLVVFACLYLFVDPQFDAYKTIKTVVTNIWSSISNSAPNRITALELNSSGSAYGYQLYNTYDKIDQTRGYSYRPENPEDISVSMHEVYLNNNAQRQFGQPFSKKQNHSVIFESFLKRSLIKKAMGSSEFKLSEAEKIDLVKGTITGINNANPSFSGWWAPLRKNPEVRNDPQAPVDVTIDGKILEDSISLWIEDEKRLSELVPSRVMTGFDLTPYDIYNDVLKPYVLSENEITRFERLYNMGSFAPKSFVEQEYIDSKKTLDGKYIFYPLKDIKDSEIEISEDEMLDYYQVNKDDFPNDKKNRIIDYYYFPTQPSENDIAKTKTKIISRVLKAKNDLDTLRLDTANGSIALLNKIRSIEKVKNNDKVKKIEKKPLSYIQQYDSIPSLGKNYFGPIVDKNKVRIGLITKEEQDSSQVIFIDQPIGLSESTIKNNMLKAKDLATAINNQNSEEIESIEKNAKNIIGPEQRSITNLETIIPGIEGEVRQIIRWVFGLDEVITVPYDKFEIIDRDGRAKSFRVNNKNALVVVVKEINENNYEDFESVRSNIKSILTQRKKAELIQEKILSNWSDDLNELAKKSNKKVTTTSKLSFKSSDFSGLAGVDAGATGFFFGSKENEISGPYVGEKGVFIFLKNKINLPEVTDTELKTHREQILRDVFIDFKESLTQESKSAKYTDMMYMSF